MLEEHTPADTLPTSRFALDHRPVRLLALGSGIALVGSFLSVLYHVTDVVGGVGWLFAYVAGAFLLASVLARVLSARAGMAVGALIFAGGLGGYLALIPDVYYALFTIERVYADLVALFLGQSVIMLLNADLWAVAIAPGPTFLTWYLALRRRYALAALAGGVTLGFFVLTGDAGRTTAMIGTAGALGLLGFGSLERHEGTLNQALDLGFLLALALFLARTVDLIPTRKGVLSNTNDDTPTLESSLLGAPGQVSIRGSISLSAEERFTVSADRPAYWRVEAYDRYTGQGWVGTGRTRPFGRGLKSPPGETVELHQRFRARARTRTMPAAWKPRFVGSDVADETFVTDMGALRPESAIEEDEEYVVMSLRTRWTPEALKDAGTDYPDRVRERYLQLPESTPGRLKERARDLANDAGSSFEAVGRITAWLKREKEYSLRTQSVRWDVADAFVFELEKGYCVHFASALAVMLRTLGIPARFVVGYTTGEPAGEGRWIVRGYHSHAWVEVYFPGTGWVAIDPTPRAPREAAEQRELQRARRGGGSGTDSGAGAETTETPTPTPTETPTPDRTDGETNETDDAGERPDIVGSGPQNDSIPGTSTLDPDRAAMQTEARIGDEGIFGGSGDDDRNTPAGVGATGRRDRLSVLFGIAGLTIGAYRIGVLERLYRSVWVRRQDPTDSPRRDVGLALDRLEYVLARRHRERRPDETPRGYLAAIEDEGAEIDERARRVVEIYERINYSGRASREEAREAIRLVDDLVSQRS